MAATQEPHPGPFARLKPHTKKGHVLKSYTSVALGKTYRVETGWYPITAEEAEVLCDVHQRPEDRDTPLAFDIATDIEDAQDIEERGNADERSAREAKSFRGGRAAPPRSARELNDATAPRRSAARGERGDMTSDDVRNVSKSPAQLAQEKAESDETDREAAADDATGVSIPGAPKAAAPVAKPATVAPTAQRRTTPRQA